VFIAISAVANLDESAATPNESRLMRRTAAVSIPMYVFRATEESTQQAFDSGLRVKPRSRSTTNSGLLQHKQHCYLQSSASAAKSNREGRASTTISQRSAIYRRFTTQRCVLHRIRSWDICCHPILDGQYRHLSQSKSHTHTHTHTHLHTYTHTHTHTCTHSHTHTDTQIHTQTHTNIHALSQTMHNRAHKHKSKNVHNTHVHSQLTPFHCQMILVPRALFVRQLMRSYWTFAPLAVAYLGLVAFSYTPDMLSLLLPGSLEAGMSGQPCTQAHTKKHTHHKQTHTYAHACTAVLCLFCMHFAPTWSFCV